MNFLRKQIIKLKQLTFKLALLLLCPVLFARAALGDPQISRLPSLPRLQDNFAISYFSFFNGPGLDSDQLDMSPNHLGKPNQDGLNLLNQISIRYKVSPTLGIDFQNRLHWIVNNSSNNPQYQSLRWEAPRVGISGRLLSGNDWNVTGAFNTDFPYFLPSPLSGYQAKQRTILFNPGLFAGFQYQPKESRWSVYTVLQPRFFIYQDRNKAESQYFISGYQGSNKPELILAVQPTLNYQLTRPLQATFGAAVDYRKNVGSDWNPLQASLSTNGDSKAWRFAPLQMMLGVTYSPFPNMSFFPYIMTHPIAFQRVDVKTGKQATLLDSTSLGFWLRGTFF